MPDKPASPRDVGFQAIAAGMEVIISAHGEEAMHDVVASCLAARLATSHPDDTPDDTGHRLLRFANMAKERWLAIRQGRTADGG